MDYFIIIAPKLVSFFLLIALGFTISKLGIFPKSCLPSLSAFLIKVVLPCLTVEEPPGAIWQASMVLCSARWPDMRCWPLWDFCA